MEIKAKNGYKSVDVKYEGKIGKKTNLTTFELSFDVQRNPDGGQIQVRQNILIQN